MPWCPECDRFLSPSSVRSDGTCPACGRDVDPGRAHAPAAAAVGVPEPEAGTTGDGQAPRNEGSAGNEGEEEPLPIPWHLKLLAGATAVYLGYRALQGIEWLVGRF